LTSDSEQALVQLVDQLRRMRVHRRAGSPSPYKPFVLLLAIRRIISDPNAERLFAYDVIASDFRSLTEAVGISAPSGGRDAFLRLGGEPFWEVDGDSTRAGFTDAVHTLMTDRNNAETVRTSILETWVDPQLRATVSAATTPR
jgi:hypothetical protein